MLWVLICIVHLTICYHDVKYPFQRESTLYNYLNVKKLLARNRGDIWSLSDRNVIRKHNHLVCKWILICAVQLTLCYYHVTYAVQSESALCSCLNVKELYTWNRRDIWRISGSNEIRTHNHLVRKRTLNHLVQLATWLSCVVSTYLYGAFDCMPLSCHLRVSEWICTLLPSSIIWPVELNS